jgi:hypothetical protein
VLRDVFVVELRISSAFRQSQPKMFEAAQNSH